MRVVFYKLYMFIVKEKKKKDTSHIYVPIERHHVRKPCLTLNQDSFFSQWLSFNIDLLLHLWHNLLLYQGLIQKVEVDIDGEKGAQISVVAKKTVTHRWPPDYQYRFYTNNILHLYVTSPQLYVHNLSPKWLNNRSWVLLAF